MEAILESAIQRAANVLKAAGATEVYVFGSALKGTMRPGSDVDFGVKGLPAARYFKIWAEAEDALGMELDLLDLDDGSPVAAYLEARGEMQRVA